jgi:hypothetical protein
MGESNTIVVDLSYNSIAYLSGRNTFRSTLDATASLEQGTLLLNSKSAPS